MVRVRLSKHEPIRLETERLQGEISYKFELEDFVWDCGWETVHRRGVVEAFLALVMIVVFGAMFSTSIFLATISISLICQIKVK